MATSFKEYAWESEDAVKEFSHIIRESMTDKQFWSYVMGWKDADVLCEEMEGWDIETIIEALPELRKIIKHNKK